MPETWTVALDSYRYPVDLRDYSRAAELPYHFNEALLPGDREQTIAFENRFRQEAHADRNVWLEVVFWKMYSQRGRREGKTATVRSAFERVISTPQSVLELVTAFQATRQKAVLKRLIAALGFTGRSIAIAATFPAVVDPENFPMADTRIAKWVNLLMDEHNAADPDGPQLVKPRYPQNRATVLTLSDFAFYDSWIDWCRHMSRKLTRRTERQWRARDVEMAVFTAWGDNEPHPNLRVNLLPPADGD